MNTIMITGSAKMIGNRVEYDIHLWAAKEGSEIQFIRPIDKVLSGYNELWQLAKNDAAFYFQCPDLLDGAYTQYLDHITLMK